MFRIFLAFAYIQSVFSYSYPPVPPYPCRYVGNVLDVRQPGVTCPVFDPLFQTYRYGQVVPAEIFYHNFNHYVHNRQDVIAGQVKYNHDLQNMYVNNEYEFYKQSPWGLPPGYENYYQNQKEWLDFTQTIQSNQIESFNNYENNLFGVKPSSP